MAEENATECDGKFSIRLDNQTIETMFRFERVAAYVVPPIFCLILLVGVVGNSLVIYVVARNHTMRNMTNILIMGLASADLLFLAICISLRTVPFIAFSWPLGDVLCRIVQYMTFAMAFMSIYVLVWMSIIRFLAIAYPLSSIDFRTPKNACIILLVTGGVILTANAPILGMFHVQRFNGFGDNRLVCISDICTNDERNLMAVFFVVGYLIPLAFIFILYGLMVWRLMCADRELRVNMSSPRSTAKWRAAKMVIIVVLTFMLCWLPAEVLFIYEYLGDRPMTYSWLICQVFAQIFAYANSCINPILYALLSGKFRSGFKGALFRKCVRSSERPNPSFMTYTFTTSNGSRFSKRTEVP